MKHIALSLSILVSTQCTYSSEQQAPEETRSIQTSIDYLSECIKNITLDPDLALQQLSSYIEIKKLINTEVLQRLSLKNKQLEEFIAIEHTFIANKTPYTRSQKIKTNSPLLTHDFVQTRPTPKLHTTPVETSLPTLSHEQPLGSQQKFTEQAQQESLPLCHFLAQ